jgi:glycosyltransferase involved in cell wall biosynthesis
VRLLDYVSGDAFDELLTNAMLFVLPSDLEGLSLALLEAMGAGLCVLASDIPENRELVDGAGFLFRPGDGADLQRMLRLLMADREVREAAGKAAKQRIQEQYLWPKIVQEVEETYLETIGWPSTAPVLVPIPDGVVYGAAPRGPHNGRLAGAAAIPMPAPDHTGRAA